MLTPTITQPYAAKGNRSQQSWEANRFLIPDIASKSVKDNDQTIYEESILFDETLASIAETLLWRLDASRAYLSLVDNGRQYFLAGATREQGFVKEEGEWFGCKTISTEGGLCERTISKACQNSTGGSTYIIEDFLSDPYFCNHIITRMTEPGLRFYAGTALTTENGIHIGTIFIMDTKPRVDGLTNEHALFLHRSAARTMRYLETKRQVYDSQRTSKLTTGLATLLNDTRNSRIALSKADEEKPSSSVSRGGIDIPTSRDTTEPAESEQQDTTIHPSFDTEEESQRILRLGAQIIQDSLAIVSGGVAFFKAHREVVPSDNLPMPQTTPSHSATDLSETISDGPPSHSASQSFMRRSSHDLSHIVEGGAQAKVTTKITSDKGSHPPEIELEFLQTLFDRYPHGYLWRFDEDGFSPSIQESFIGRKQKHHRRRSLHRPVSRGDDEDYMEAHKVREFFPNSRQVLLVPLWDPSSAFWHSGCFIWNDTMTPVYTSALELAALNSFMSTLVSEISRLDALKADSAKSKLLSSISHEFRSPLHAIMTSTQFLLEGETLRSQEELLSILSSNGFILLDTMNHVLDFSRINDLDPVHTDKVDSDLRALYAYSNLALRCEEVLEGMVMSRTFRGAILADNGHPKPLANTEASADRIDPVHNLVVRLHIEPGDWNFFTQPGAVSRILMNLFGNAQKYTQKGFIHVSISQKKSSKSRIEAGKAITSPSTSDNIIELVIQDSGKGMSPNFLQHGAFQSFSQEDPMTSGVGLGLSIVQNLVKQLGGEIRIQSRQNYGTKVTVKIPMKRQASLHDTQKLGVESQGLDDTNQTEQQYIRAAQALAKTHAIVILSREATIADTNSRGDTIPEPNVEYVRATLEQWYGFKICSLDKQDQSVDMMVADEADLAIPWQDLIRARRIPLLLFCSSEAFLQRQKMTDYEGLVRFVAHPAGPYKLAKCIVQCLNEFPRATQEALNGHDMSLQMERINLLQSSLSKGSISQSTSLPLMTNSVIGELHKPSKTPSSSTHVTANANSSSLNNKELQKTPADIPQQASRSHLNILAVDDNDVNLKLLCRYLEKRNHAEVDIARDGAQAVKAFNTATEAYDIIFMDLSMPVMDGFEATYRIREQSKRFLQPYRAPYIVAMTGLGGSDDRKRALECGVDEYLTKPVNFPRVNKILAERLAQICT